MSVDFKLERFVEAQRHDYERAHAEVLAGRKESHWMWYVYPQVAGLGHSPMAQRYAISGLPEATEYARHPLLGNRLEEMLHAVTRNFGKRIRDVFGHPDDMKLCSSATLFFHASEERSQLKYYCREVIAEFFGNRFCERTEKSIGILRNGNGDRVWRNICKSDHEGINRYIFDLSATVPGYLALLDRITNETGFVMWDCMCVGAACKHIETNSAAEKNRLKGER